MFVWSGSAWVSVASEVESLANYATVNYASAQPGMKMVVPTSVSVGSGTASVDTVGNVTFSGASSVTINGAFTSTYEDYKLVLKISASTATADLLAQLTASGTPLSTSTYDAAYFAKVFGAGASVSAANTSQTSWILSGLTNSSTVADYGTYDISNPFASKYKSFIGTATRQDGYLWLNGGRVQTSTSSYDGIKLFPTSGTISGTIRLYGYKNG
jgi:hypothetical protein